MTASETLVGKTATKPRRWSGRRTVVAGLVGALLLIGGAGCYLALSNVPYGQDESSHVGYALKLRSGELPSLDTKVPTSGGGPLLRRALQRPYPFSVPEIHVANNPPFPYLAGLPLMEVTIRAGVRGGPLLGLRLLDLAGAVAAVGLAFLLGRELSGDDDFVGLVTAGLVAGVIGVPLITAAANIDGPAFAATTGVTWALARFARTRTLKDTTWLGLWCAGAAAVRPMALVFAAVAGVLALVIGWRALGSRSLVSLTVRLAAPTLVLTGWFYALNLHRYGDFTGSQGVFDKFGIKPGPSTLSTLMSPRAFVHTFAYLVTEVYGRSPWWEYSGPRPYLITAAVIALLAGAIALSIRSSRSSSAAVDDAAAADVDDAERSGAGKLVPAAWISVAVLACVPMVLIAQHVHGGGANHPRYLFPVLPIVAAAAALLAARISRWLAVAAVAAFAIAELTRLRAGGHLTYKALNAPELRGALVDQPYRGLSFAVAIVGAVVLLAALVHMASMRRAVKT